MKRRVLAFAAMMAVLSSCGERPVVDTPQASKESFLRIADVLVSAQCELEEAALRSDAAFSFAKAAMTLTLTVTDNETTGGGLTLAIPVGNTRVSLERSRRPIGSATRRMEFQIVHDVGKQLDCPREETPEASNGARYIAGGLGLREWLQETDDFVLKSGETPREISYELAFDIALSTSLNPIFSRENEDGVSPDVESEATDDRRVRHRIAVTLVPDAGRSKPPLDEELLGATRSFLERLATR